MKKIGNTLTLLIITICIILSGTFLQSSAATLTQSQFDAKLAEVEAKYPQGTQDRYWYVNGGYVGQQCHGYARWISYYVWGTDFANGKGANWVLRKSTSSSTYIDSLVPGDVVRFRRAGKTWNHTIFITKISGSTIYFTDCNSDGKCTILYRQTISKSDLTAALKLALYNSSNEAASYGYIAHYTPNTLGTQSLSYKTGQYKTTASSGLRLRNSASTSGSQLALIPYGTTVNVTKVSGNWGYTSYSGKSGWICLDYASYVNHTHSYTSKVTKVAKCTSKGTKTFTCSCGSSYTESINALGHDYTGQRVYQGEHPHEISQRCVRYDTCKGFKWTGENYTLNSCSSCWNVSWSLSQSSISVKVGESKTINASFSGVWPDTMTSRGEWDEELFDVTFGKGTITVKGLKAGSGSIKMYIWSDGSKNTLIGSKTIPVTITANPKQIYASTAVVNLTLGETTSKTINVWSEGYHSNTCVYNWSTNNNIISCTWGEWTNGKLPLTITAKGEGGAMLTLAIKDKTTGTVLDTYNVAVNVSSKKYTINYNANGGTGAPSNQTKNHGSSLTLSSITPTRFGYNFTGWATSSNATSANYQPGSSYSSNSSVTLYAVWKSASSFSYNTTYSVPISYDGQMYYYKYKPSSAGIYVIYSTGDKDTRVYLYNSSGTEIASNDDGGSGRNFRLSYNLKGGNTYYFGVRYYSNSTTGKITTKFGKVYTVSYNANGGTGTPSSQTKDYGQTLTLTTTKPVRTGYTFFGWATSGTASTANYSAGSSYSKNASVTLYAVWKANTYNVKYNGNGATGSMSNSSHVYDTSKALSANKFKKSGYNFLGWSKNSAATTATYMDKQSVKNLTSTNGDTITLYAVWSKHIHSYASKVTETATCSSTGVRTYTCTCGSSYTETISKLSHSYNDYYTIDKGATCTVNGSKSKHCTRSGCSAKTSVTAIEATGHKYDSGKVTEKATYTQTGIKTYTCTVCKTKKTEPIAKLKLGRTSRLTAKPKSNEIKLTWEVVEGATGYRVYQYDYTKKKSDRLATITGTSYTIKNLKASTKYRFSVKAYSLIDGEKVWSDSYTIIETQTCPGVTNKITAVSTTTTIKLTWNKVSGATGYRVYRYNAAEKKWVIVVNETTKTTATIKFKTGAKTKFAVKSYKKLGDGTILWSSSYKTIETATKTATPKISKLTSSSKGKAVITWTNVSGENGFQVYYSTKKNGDFKKYSNYKGNTTKATVSKLKSGKTYYFKVRTYKTTDSGYVYSSWSSVKGIKIK